MTPAPNPPVYQMPGSLPTSQGHLGRRKPIAPGSHSCGRDLLGPPRPSPSGTHQSGRGEGWARPAPRHRRPSGRHTQRFQSLFIRKRSQSLRMSESNPSRNHLRTNSSPSLLRRKIEHLPPTQLLTLGSSGPKPYCCLPAGWRSQGRVGRPRARTTHPTAAEGGARGCGCTPPSPRTACLRSAPQLSPRILTRQADAEPSLAHTDMIQEKGFQTTKCNRQRDRPHKAPPLPSPPGLRSSCCQDGCPCRGGCAGPSWHTAERQHAPAVARSGTALGAPKQ